MVCSNSNKITCVGAILMNLLVQLGEDEQCMGNGTETCLLTCLIPFGQDSLIQTCHLNWPILPYKNESNVNPYQMALHYFTNLLFINCVLLHCSCMVRISYHAEMQNPCFLVLCGDFLLWKEQSSFLTYSTVKVTVYSQLHMWYKPYHQCLQLAEI